MEKSISSFLFIKVSTALMCFIMVLSVGMVQASVLESSIDIPVKNVTHSEDYTLGSTSEANDSTITERGRYYDDSNQAVMPDALASEIQSCLTSQTVSNTSDSGAGSLRNAIIDACSGGTVDFASGLSGQTITLTSGQLTVNKSLTIQNPNAPGLVISGGYTSRVFDITNSSDVTLDRLIISDGNAGTSFGGGVRMESGGQLLITNSIIENNAARAGGGVRSRTSSSTITIRNSTIRNNSTPNEGGGGINNDDGSVMLIENSTISGNSGRFAGGIANYNGAELTIVNSTISGNSCSATSSGGGVENFTGGSFGPSSLTIRHSTITDNTCTTSGSGGGIFNNTTAPVLSHTIVAGNAGASPDLQGSFESGGYNLIGNGSGSSGIANGVDGNQVGSGSTPIDPMLGSLSDNGGPTLTHALLTGSPAIDAGNNTDAPATDQRGSGFLRILNGTIDIGSYETCFDNLTVGNTNDAGFGSLRERIVSTCTGGTVDFESGLSGQTITLTSGQLTVNKSLTIQNPNAPGLVISGGYTSRVFDITNSSDVTLDRLIISDGNAGTSFGGGVRMESGGQLLITNSIIENNAARAGGGVRSRSSSSTTTIRNSTIRNNTTPNEGGGGINNDAGSVMLIENSTISGNSGRFAGGIANYNGAELTIVNSTISGNSCSATSSGGGVENFTGGSFGPSSLTIRHSTITDNTCTTSGSGGGIFNNTTAPVLSHTIVAGNAGASPDLQGSFESGGYNLIGNGSGSSGIANGVDGNQVGSGSTPIDPMLGSLSDNGGPTLTHALLTGSPAIDAGNPTLGAELLPTDALGNPIDQRGIPRFQGEAIDIGASEFEVLSVLLTGKQGFRFLSAPVVTSLSDFLNPIWTQGIEGADTESGNPNVWILDTSTEASDPSSWVPVTSMDHVLQAGDAVLVYVFEDDEFEVTTENPWPKTLSVDGELNTLPVSPSLNVNPEGFTLLGNPTVSSFAWSDVTRTHLNDAVYVWDPNKGAEGGYVSWSMGVGDLDDGIIRPFQGFIVQSASGSGTPFLEINSTTIGGQFFGKQSDNLVEGLSTDSNRLPSYIRFSLIGQGLESSAWLVFTAGGSEDLDSGDALKLRPLANDFALLSTRTPTSDLLDINHLPLSLESPLYVPMHVEATQSGLYTIQITDFELPLNSGWDIRLRDYQTGEELKVVNGMEYSFEVSSADVEKITAESRSNSSAKHPKQLSLTSDEDYRFAIRIYPGGTESEQIPQILALDQNFPNPFNPVTTIGFQLPQTAQVTLEVFDITGRIISTVVSGYVEAGFHQVPFDASRLSSGVYIYRLRAGNQVFTRKMTLIK